MSEENFDPRCGIQLCVPPWPLPDLASDPDLDDEDEDEENNHEIKELPDLEEFSRTLAEAQRIAIEAKDERLKGTGRPKQYLGNSAQTKQRYNQISKGLEKKGYLSVKTWFEKAKASNPKSNGVPDIESGNWDADSGVIAVDEDQGHVQISTMNLDDGNPAKPLELPEDVLLSPCDTNALIDACEMVEDLLQELREGRKPGDDTPPTESDVVLDQLNYKDLPKLQWACAALTVKSKDKKINVIF